MEGENQQQGQQKYSGDPISDLFGRSNKDYDALRQAVTQGVQEGLKNYNPAKTSQSIFKDRQADMQMSHNSTRRAQNNYKRTGNITTDFVQGIKDQLMDSIAGGSFKAGMQGALNEFYNQFGVELKNVPHEFGKMLGNKAFDAIKNSKMGQNLYDKATKMGNSLLNRMFDGKGESGAAAKQGILNVIKAFKSSGGSGGQISGVLGSVVSKGAATNAASSVAGAGGTALASSGGGTAMAGLAKGAASLGPWGILIAGIILTIAKIFGPLFKGIGEMAKALGKAFNREEEMRKKRMENAKKREEEDLKYLAKQPFDILEAAAQKWYDTWDQNLAKVSLTQGYTKEDVYDLYSSISERLISEGLGSAIAGTDVVSKLSQVLDAGLSGRIAEEFAYEAAKLGAAIPTQDFIGYASTYAQLASEARARGLSEADAIAYANDQLETFASNLLYSSRTLTGGFTTGLKDAQSLFTSAVEIAQTARTSNAAEISGVLTSVSAVIGSVAPDLASGLVNNIVSAAVGGNSDAIVALRSLAGVNAGNTEFLQQLAKDPQGIFVNIFRSLASMQNMSPANYMEVAEGLASVFGVDMKALARVDFDMLANNIASMSVNQASLGENISLLASGEATTTAEQLKLQEINNMILEEGLAYVIDSEAGRAIQQHMWDEQIANELANTEYAVSLQGAGLEFLEGIRKTITNILNFLNPIGFIAKGIKNMVATSRETQGYKNDIQEILQLGAVGSNKKAFYNLTTTGKDLALMPELVEMMGGTAGLGPTLWEQYGLPDMFDTISAAGAFTNPAAAPFLASTSLFTGGLVTDGESFNQAGGLFGTNSLWGSVLNLKNTAGLSTANSSYSSVYSGFNASVGKSLAAVTGSKTELGAIVKDVAASATVNALEESNKHTQAWLDSAAEAAKSMTYEAFKDTARDFGIADVAEAISDYGKTEEEIRGYFEANQAKEGAIKEEDRKADEQLFRDQTRKFWDYDTGTSGIFQSAVWLPFLNDNFKPFFDSGARYDQRMDAVDLALSQVNAKLFKLNERIGESKEFTVIGVLESIRSNLISTFVSTNSSFQKCLADWVRYIASSKAYNTKISEASAWSELRNAEGDRQNETLLALANAMNVFSAEELQKLDPQMQANALLGKIVIILEAMMQQQNTQAGGLSLPDTLSALGFGMTFKST